MDLAAGSKMKENWVKEKLSQSSPVRLQQTPVSTTALLLFDANVPWLHTTAVLVVQNCHFCPTFQDDCPKQAQLPVSQAGASKRSHSFSTMIGP